MAAASPLDPLLVARLASLTLRARGVMDGVLTGMHRSPHQGSSIEFAEHKEYAPGDDVRFLDWKALARFDRLYIKKYEDETNLRAFILLDASASMAYAGKGSVSKFHYGQTIAAALLYLLTAQQDASGVSLFAGSLRRQFPPRSGRAAFHDCLRAIEESSPEGRSDFETAFNELDRLVQGRALVVVVSDLLDVSDDALTRLQQLKLRRHDVALFHLLDRDETDFPFDVNTRFESLEDERMVIAEPQAMRAAYLAVVREFIDGVRRRCHEVGIDYMHAVTDQPYDEVLLPFLKGRARR